MNRRKFKFKRDRSLLTNTFDHPKSSFNVKPTKPGIHKKKMYSNTYYGERLHSKQKMLAYYCNMKDYQLKNIFIAALRFTDYKSRIIKSLESRLDTVLYRSGCVSSMSEARQIINHRKVTVTMNNKVNIITSPSFQIKSDALIQFEKKCENRLVNTQKANVRAVPKHILFNADVFNINIQTDYMPSDISSTDLKGVVIEDIVSYYKI